MINSDTIKALRDAIEKCGGPGGKPGPCPGPRKPQAGKKPPKKPTKPEGPNGSYSREQLQAHNRRPQKPSKPPKKPPKKPKTLEEAVMPHFDEIQKSRKKVHQLALKLGFKPTSKDPDVAVQQAMEWAQVRAAKKVLGAEVGKTKPAKKPTSTGKPAPKKPTKPVATETGKTKPPKDKMPPKKPGKQPTQAPAAKKLKTVDGIENEAESIIELSKSPETRRVDVGHPTIARLAGRSFSKIVQSLAGMKPSEIWPNRRQAAKNLAEKFRTEFTDEKVEARIQAVHAHVKKVFTKEGAAARIISNFLKEQPW